MNNSPFTEKILTLNREGVTFNEMWKESDGVYSAGWWNNIANGSGGNPPPPEKLRGIAKLFKMSREDVAAMIAMEWYDIKAEAPASTQSPRAQSLIDSINALSDEDAKLVAALVHRIAKKGG